MTLDSGASVSSEVGQGRNCSGDGLSSRPSSPSLSAIFSSVSPFKRNILSTCTHGNNHIFKNRDSTKKSQYQESITATH